MLLYISTKMRHKLRLKNLGHFFKKCSKGWVDANLLRRLRKAKHNTYLSLCWWPSSNDQLRGTTYGSLLATVPGIRDCSQIFSLFPGGRFHALGVAGERYLRKYPFKSADSLWWIYKFRDRQRRFTHGGRKDEQAAG